jgi:cell division septum initiation protein DivIVA
MTVADETEFTVACRGYDRAQVDGQIDMLSTQLRTAAAARESAVAEVQVLSRRLEAGVGERIAQDEVNDMRQRATSSAAHVLALGQAEADELRERSEAERHEFDAERHTAQN